MLMTGFHPLILVSFFAIMADVEDVVGEGTEKETSPSRAASGPTAVATSNTARASLAERLNALKAMRVRTFMGRK